MAFYRRLMSGRKKLPKFFRDGSSDDDDDTLLEVLGFLRRSPATEFTQCHPMCATVSLCSARSFAGRASATRVTSFSCFELL